MQIKYPRETFLPWDGSELSGIKIVKKSGGKYLEFTVNGSEWVERARFHKDTQDIIEINCLLDRIKPEFRLLQTGCHYFKRRVKWYYITRIDVINDFIQEYPSYPKFNGITMTPEIISQVQRWLIFTQLFNLLPSLELRGNSVVMPYQRVKMDRGYIQLTKIDLQRWFNGSLYQMLHETDILNYDVSYKISRLICDQYPYACYIRQLYLQNRSALMSSQI